LPIEKKISQEKIQVFPIEKYLAQKTFLPIEKSLAKKIYRFCEDIKV
jgi:hypothetical protein